MLGVLSILGSWSWVTPGAQRCPHVTPHGWPCQMAPQEPFCTSCGFSRNSREEEEAAGTSLTHTPFPPSFPGLWSFGKSLIPGSFSQAQSLQVVPHCVNPEHSLGSFWVLSLLPNFFPLSSLHVSWTPQKRPLPPSPMGAFAQGCSPAKSVGFAFPGHHIPVTFPAHSWESPFLRFLFHPGTLKQKPGDASQQTQGTSLPFLPGWGFSLTPGTFILPSTFPRLQTGIPGMQPGPPQAPLAGKSSGGPGPIPRMLLMPLETLLLRRGFFPDLRMAAPGAGPSRAREASQCCPLQVTLVARDRKSVV